MLPTTPAGRAVGHLVSPPQEQQHTAQAVEAAAAAAAVSAMRPVGPVSANIPVSAPVEGEFLCFCVFFVDFLYICCLMIVNVV